MKGHFQFDCEKRGLCFNKLYRPNWEQLNDALPGALTFGDIDGVTNVGERFLFIEWKSHENIPMGERISMEQLTSLSDKILYLVVIGECNPMVPQRYCLYYRGLATDMMPITLQELYDRIKAWADAADAEKRRKGCQIYHRIQEEGRAC